MGMFATLHRDHRLQYQPRNKTTIDWYRARNVRRRRHYGFLVISSSGCSRQARRRNQTRGLVAASQTSMASNNKRDLEDLEAWAENIRRHLYAAWMHVLNCRAALIS